MEKRRRKDLRLQAYDYSQCGAYFVTICTQNRRRLFDIVSGYGVGAAPCGRPRINLLPLGRIAEAALSRVTAIYDVTVDSYVIMPNHIHFVLVLPEARATARVAPTVGRIVGAYKSIVANEWRKRWEREGKQAGAVWQRGYYEHVIRCEEDLLDIRRYIEDNPLKWREDPEHAE